MDRLQAIRSNDDTARYTNLRVLDTAKIYEGKLRNYIFPDDDSTISCYMYSSQRFERDVKRYSNASVVDYYEQIFSYLKANQQTTLFERRLTSMGYYSELAIDGAYYEDRSYPSPELQLKWRLEDLRSRLKDISMGKIGITAHCFIGCRYSKDDLAYTTPEYFFRESDIMDAIAMAEERLASMEAEEAELREIEKIKTNMDEFPGQLTIWDILYAEINPISQHEEELKTAA